METTIMTIEDRLRRLKARRTGSDRSSQVAAAQQLEILAKILAGEDYERRQADKPYTRYALGAMAEVDFNYTRISHETADRVQSQLARRLPSHGLDIEFRLQGSVPLNVHIRGVSDIDLLVLATRSLLLDRYGVRAQQGYYSPAVVEPIDLLASLRRHSESELTAAYPAADVDRSKPKAIKLSGGSLPRPVDVVPAVWWDTAAYQLSGRETDRGVSIYHKAGHYTIDNLPFLHIQRIDEQDRQAYGGLRKAIRLCKNIKADVEEDGRNVALSSYDIAGLLYHANLDALRAGAISELGIIAEAQRHFDWCYANQDSAKRLRTPDGSRAILDSQERIDGLLTLSVQLDELATQVAKEHSLEIRLLETPSLERARRVLSQTVIA
jgi:hypothetical protein